MVDWFSPRCIYESRRDAGHPSLRKTCDGLDCDKPMHESGSKQKLEQIVKGQSISPPSRTDETGEVSEAAYVRHLLTYSSRVEWRVDIRHNNKGIGTDLDRSTVTTESSSDPIMPTVQLGEQCLVASSKLFHCRHQITRVQDNTAR